MRSLEEWTKYLEQQEQTLRQVPGQDAPDEPEPVPESPVQVARAVATAPQPAPTVSEEHPAPAPKPETPPAAAEPAVARRPAMPKPAVTATPDAKSVTVSEAVRLRQKLPEAFLAADVGAKNEIAQSSYKSFRESRDELLQRLLDPPLSLEDAARILNVCPTTVRRYTNRGLLKHYRTAGNQRRFRLSDVLAFLESQLSYQDRTE